MEPDEIIINDEMQAFCPVCGEEMGGMEDEHGNFCYMCEKCGYIEDY